MIAAELATLPWGYRQSPSGDSALTRTDVQALMQVSDTGLYRAQVIHREGTPEFILLLSGWRSAPGRSAGRSGRAGHWRQIFP